MYQYAFFLSLTYYNILYALFSIISSGPVYLTTHSQGMLLDHVLISLGINFCLSCLVSSLQGDAFYQPDGM